MKRKNKIIMIFVFFMVFIMIPMIYSANENSGYELYFDRKSNIEVGDNFHVKIKLIGDDISEENKKMYFKFQEKIVLEETILKGKNIEYNYDREKNILELDKKTIKDEIEISLKAVSVGEVTLELYEEEEKLDSEEINIGEKEDITALASEVSKEIKSISPRSLRVVTTGQEFHDAMKDTTVTEISVVNDFAITTPSGLFAMNSYRRDIVINGNGHTVDFRNLSYNFNSTSSTNHNNITLKNIDIQGQNYYGPIMMDGVANTGGSIIYEDISYEGSQMTSAYVADIYIKGIVNSSSVGSYISKIDGNKYTTNASNQQNLDVTNVIFTSNSIYNGYAENSTLLYLRNGGSAVLEENAIVNLERDGNTGELAPYVTLYLQGNLDLEKNSKLNVKTKSGSTAGGIRIAGTGKYLRIKEGAEVNVNTAGVMGATTDRAGISVGDGAILDVAPKGEININLQNTGTSTRGGIYAGHSSSITVQKDGILDIKADGTGAKNLIQIGSSSNFQFADAEKINLEFLGTPNTSSRLVYMTSGKLVMDIQSVSVWDRNLPNLIPTNVWTPIWFGNINYTGGNVTSVTANSMNSTIRDEFISNFRTQNYKRVLFEKIPAINITIDPLSSNPTLNNSHIIKGKSNPNSYIRLSGDVAIPAGTLDSPVEGETDKYHVKADINGDYSYSLTPGKYLTGGNVVEAYGFLNGQSDIASTTVESVIYIPDPNLRKTINKELTGTASTLPMYFKIEEMESLTKLIYSGQSLTDSNKIVDLTGLEYATNILDIDFRSNKITDLTPISKLDKLKVLSLQYNKITKIPDMKDMSQLEKLDLMNTGISDVTNISKIPNLKDLNMDMNNLTDISSLSDLVTLNKLTARQNQILDISALQSMPDLNYINLGFNKIDNISAIGNLLKLQSVDFTGNNISNIKSVENLINLKSLYVGQNKISDISYLDKLTNLTSLNIYKNEVEDISYLSNKTELTYFVGNFNKIKDITPLKNLNKLNYLAIVGNQITDISSLDAIIGNITTFFAADQNVNLGTVKINGNRLKLYNPAKTVEGVLPISIVSDGGAYDLGSNTIEWINLGSTQPRSLEFEDNKRDFSGTINLTVSRVDIMSPNNPDSLNTSPNPEGIVDFNHDLKLAINYIEPIDFGVNGIEAGDMTIQAVTKTPYIQITDLRDVASGWKLNLRGDVLQEDKPGGATIDGVKIRFKNGEMKSSPTGNLENPLISTETVVLLGDTSSVQIMEATSGKGSGTWLGIWDSLGSKNEKVIMEIPSGKSRIGNYKTTLNWELTDTP